MIYILWAVLNVLMYAYFFYLLIGFIVLGRRVFDGKLRPVAIIVMTMGIFHIFPAFAIKPEKNKTDIFLTEYYNPQTKTEYKSLILEENAAFDIRMTVTYSVENEEWKPIHSQSYVTGWLLGFDWEFYHFNTNKIQENFASEYMVHGGLKWHLFGYHIYTQSKQFSGRLF